MNISILTLFPEAFSAVFKSSIIKRALDKNLVKLNIVNIRNFAKDKHKKVDDRPYGGGSGMVMKVDIVTEALGSIKPKPYTVLLSASGAKFTQKKAISYSKRKNLTLICGHYEGVDARVEKFVDEVISIGDFVLTGGEIAAMAIVDSVIRLIPNAIKKESKEEESFSKNLLEYPQYTRPENFKGHKVPKILLSGDHNQISSWRKKEAQKRTRKYRPDLL